MTPLFLSRASLRRDAAVGAIAPILLPKDGNDRVNATHRLVWSLFADHADRRRDFLWREEGRSANRSGRKFYILSTRPPADRLGIFDLETKPFEPALTAGDRLRFDLRANPVTSELKPGAKRGKRVDPVARALAKLAPEERAQRRHDIMLEIGRRWLAAQGERAGFALTTDPASGRPRLAVDGADWRVLARGKDRGPISFSVLDFEGEILLRDPAVFLAALARGFGKAKAFGCGLMLIRRV
jgi:CRISPR system Cascade subunit CasE